MTTVPDWSATEADRYARAEIEYWHSGLYDARVCSWGINLAGMTILDLGAGPGVWEAVLSNHGPHRMVWQDHSETFREIARRLHAREGLENVEYRTADLLALDYPPESFDLVLCRLALYYCRDEWRALERIAGIVKRPGYVYLEFPNFRWLGTCHTVRRALAFPLLATAPWLAILTRRKLLPTRYQLEWFLRWRMGRQGFVPVWRQQSEVRTTTRILWLRTCREKGMSREAR